MPQNWNTKWEDAKKELFPNDNEPLPLHTKLQIASYLLQEYSLVTPLINQLFSTNIISKIGLFFTGHIGRHHVDTICNSISNDLIKGFPLKFKWLYVHLARAGNEIKPEGDLGLLLKVCHQQELISEEQLNAFFAIGPNVMPDLNLFKKKEM